MASYEQSPRQFVRPSEGSPLFEENTRIIFKYNRIEERRIILKLVH